MISHTHGKPEDVTSREPCPSDIVPSMRKASVQEHDACFYGAFDRVCYFAKSQASGSSLAEEFRPFQGGILIACRNCRIRVPEANGDTDQGV